MSSSKILRTVVLVGISVLSCEASAWRVDLNFNNGTPGTVAQKTNGGFSDAASGSYYTTAQSYEGGMACELNIAQGEFGYGKWGGVITHPTVLKKGDQIWFRVRTFMPVGFNYDSYGEGNHLKFLRIHTQTPTGSNVGYDDWYINPKGSSTAHQFIYEGEQVWDFFAPASQAPVLGQWETYEMYVKLDDVPVSAGGQGRVRVWKNGVLLKDITNRKTLSSATDVSDRSHLFTYWNGSSPATQKMYVDDIVLTSDTPSERDANGNPYVGVGKTSAPPVSPALNVQ